METQEQRPVVVEQTAKKYKKQLLFSIVLSILGVIVGIASDGSVFGSTMLIGGIIWFVFTKIRIWWHHA